METLNMFDYAVFVLYFTGLIWMAVRLGKGDSSQEDYYVGGRNLPWWAVGISTAATQTSAIGFMSFPAFIAMKEGGSLRILQGEFVLPIAMICVMVTLIPFFRKLELISVYDYLERRFDRSVRYLVSGVFLFSRGAATAVGLYMISIVFSTVMDMPLWSMIIIIGIITLIYDTIGGIKAVVYSDVIQMGVLLLGAFLIIGYAVSEIGGMGATFEIIRSQMGGRLDIIDITKHGFGDGGDFAFLPQFIGGFFLLASYYGCDQTQTQRELSASSLDETKKSLIFNGFFRFPLALLYSAIGLAMGAYAVSNQEFVSLVGSMGKVDYMLPVFIMNQIPHGIKAIIFMGVLAAAMSSLDSSLNSLSAASMNDFVEPLVFRKKPSDKVFLRWSKGTTVLWGGAVTAMAFFVGAISDTVIEAIGIIGSAFYGPILAAFLTGVLFHRINSRGVFAGIIAGVAFNGLLHFAAPGIFWMWWNCIGCIVTMGVAMVVSLFPGGKQSESNKKYVIWNTDLLKGESRWLKVYAGLVAYCVFMIGLCWLIPVLIRAA